MRQTAAEQFYAEWEVEPPNGVYPTLDEWGVALAEVHRREERIEHQRNISAAPVSAFEDALQNAAQNIGRGLRQPNSEWAWQAYCVQRGVTPKESPYVEYGSTSVSGGSRIERSFSTSASS